jgi:hypothetical protein
VLVLYWSYGRPQSTLPTNWWPRPIKGIEAVAAIAQGAITGSRPAITGAARPVEAARSTAGSLSAYNQGSVLVESVGEGSIALYRRKLESGGSLAYIVVMLDGTTQLEVINADGAMPGSDAAGDTIWLDGKRHLQPVVTMVGAPYATRPNMELLGAMAYGFHGDARTSNEGTVVANGTVMRVNPGRTALCITQDGHAQIGLYDAETAQGCWQAFGAGPVLMVGGKIANTEVAAESDAFVPFNPFGEDFVQLDWRKMIFNGTYPKTIMGIGKAESGADFVVLAVSYDARGIEVVQQLRAMGCSDAIGGDDDTSTQMVWRGVPVVDRKVRSVPDAIGVYLKH